MNSIISKPNFFVIGVVKGGTTSLYHYLDQHPDIYLPPIKETNHFASADVNESAFLKEYALDVKIDLDRYIEKGMNEQVHIAHVNAPEHYRALFSRVKAEKAIGEVSNSYMICPSAAKAIHSFEPDAKILVVLRNPIRRAWSQYLMNLREAKSKEVSFIDELKIDDKVDSKGWGVNHQYLELGKYAGQLERYIELFGREQILPIFYEKYRSDPQFVLSEICSFLEVDPGFSFHFGVESNRASIPRSKTLNKVLVSGGIIKSVKNLVPKNLRRKFAKILYTDKNLPSIRKGEEEWLRDYYLQEVKDLSILLKTDVTEHWPEFKDDDYD